MVFCAGRWGGGLLLPVTRNSGCRERARGRRIVIRGPGFLPPHDARMIKHTEVIEPETNHSANFFLLLGDQPVGSCLLGRPETSRPASFSPYPRFIHYNATARLVGAGPLGMLLLLGLTSITTSSSSPDVAEASTIHLHPRRQAPATPWGVGADSPRPRTSGISLPMCSAILHGNLGCVIWIHDQSGPGIPECGVGLAPKVRLFREVVMTKKLKKAVSMRLSVPAKLAGGFEKVK